MLWSLFLPLLWTGSLAQDQRYQLTVPKSVTVQEGLCVLVPCRVIYPFSLYSPHPVFGYWFKKGANIHHGSPVATNDPQKPVHTATKNRFLLLGDPQKQNCSLFIRDAQKRDAGMYFFRVEGDPSVRYSYGESQLSVHVLALTKIPDILIPPTLEPGQSINLTCSVPWACERGTPPIFSWMSVALTSLGPRTTLSSVLTLTGRPQDHGTNLTCQVTFPGAGVTVERTVQLNVTWDPGTTATSGMVLAAIGGAGVTALLFVGLCLIFFTVNTHRKKADRTVAGMNHVRPSTRLVFQSQQQDSSVHSPPGNPSSSQEAPAVGTEQHLHYASLVFHGSRPWVAPLPSSQRSEPTEEPSGASLPFGAPVSSTDPQG
ncbi:myeloid cell surface antigen CD33-like isoform X2 [Nannospalax galili]|uniref:myeloid cell surface antigen CD33-like isoform X2 n=1 Tax=Nannospalax galili TaxID=1026970 RepID=UPI00111C4961|nr:myeloid cell surface antigen CD33-like isoform X2 [Nannospalax galili]